MNFDHFKLQHSQIRYCLNIEKAMHISCKYGNFELSKLIFANFPDIDIHKYMNGDFPDYTFRSVCKNNHLEIAKWLKTTWPSIDHTLVDDIVFDYCIDYQKNSNFK